MSEIIRRKNHQPVYGPIGESVARRSYLKPKNLSYIHKTNSDVMEKWEDLCYRVAQGNINFLSRSVEPNEAQELYDALVDMKILLGGRHFCNTGIKGREFVGNCFVSGWNWLRIGFHFSFTFERLMEGGGVGANYSDMYFKDSPRIRPVKVMYSCSTKHKDYANMRSMLTRKKQKGVKTFVIPDSREGWTKALDMLITAFGGGYPYLLNFDFSEIRPQGSKLKRTGGAASGPEPLLRTFKTISDLLMDNVGKKFDWEMGMIIDQAIAECVMAGGCRRSARMAVKHWKDEGILDFIAIKKGGTEHWTTNISVIVDNEFLKALEEKDEWALKVFEAVIDGMFINGEPGFAFYDNAIKGENRFYSPNACFPENELLLTSEGYVPFCELYEAQKRQEKLLFVAPDGVFHEGRVIPAGNKQVITLQRENKKQIIELTPDHKVMTVEKGLIEAKDTVGLHLKRYSHEPLKVESIVETGNKNVFDFTINTEDHLGVVSNTIVLNCGEFFMEEGEFCNTGHQNLARIESDEEAKKIAKLVTRALMRANYCDLPSESREITDKNQRIGVGIMGIQNFSLKKGIKYSEIPDSEYMKDFFTELYATVRQTADDYADELGINRPIKTTTVAPTGSVGQVAGATTGCQSIIYKYYIRRMRLHIDDPQVMEYKNKGYKIEVDSNAPETGVIVCIPMKDPLLDEFPEELIEDQGDVGAEKALKLQEFLQEYWADNSISFTINFDPREVDRGELGTQILKSLPKLKGTTVLPELHNYAQPPYTRITKEEYLEEISRIQDKESSETIEVQCAGGSCEIII